MTYSNDRLDRIETILETSAHQWEVKHAELQALMESNARSIQALSEAIASDRLDRLQFQQLTTREAQEREELRQATLDIKRRLYQHQQGEL